VQIGGRTDLCGPDSTLTADSASNSDQPVAYIGTFDRGLAKVDGAQRL
jgi:hypothetical protein